MAHAQELHQKSRVARLRLAILCALLTFTLLLAPLLLSCTDATTAASAMAEAPEELPPLVLAGGISCDCSAFRSDVCFMCGDVRTHSPSGSILLVSKNFTAMEERIKPYTRKWEAAAMDTVAELRLRSATDDDGGRAHSCDVRHDVPAVVFSTGGYTGNVYHDFNDGLIPLFITSQHFHRMVVFIVLDYHRWWAAKYGAVLSRLSDHPPIDFAGDARTHCFPEATVGLRIHGELSVDPARMRNNTTIADFRRLLDDAYGPPPGDHGSTRPRRRPKLVIVQRNGSRAIENADEAAAVAVAAGFRVEVLTPGPGTALSRIHRAMSTCDAVVGVHGAAMAHILFMRPGAAFVQIVPVGTDWPAAAYYGEPAASMGLHYVAYRILPRESSLFQEYAEDDAVLRDPDSVNAGGWAATKKVYLDGQRVRLDLARFRRSLVKVRDYLFSRRSSSSKRQLRRPLKQQAKYLSRKTT